jgi:hypothetical protein
MGLVKIYKDVFISNPLYQKLSCPVKGITKDENEWSPSTLPLPSKKGRSVRLKTEVRGLLL